MDAYVSIANIFFTIILRVAKHNYKILTAFR